MIQGQYCEARAVSRLIPPVCRIGQYIMTITGGRHGQTRMSDLERAFVPLRRFWWARSAVAAALLVALLACTAAEGATPLPDSTATPQPTPTVELPSGEPGISPDSILFGQSAAFSGPAQELGINMSLGIEAAFAEANLDALIIMGNDQQEQFHDDNMPALAAYWGETIKNVPPHVPENAPASRKASAWGWAADREIDYPVQHRLSLHVIESLMEEQFDVAHTRRLPQDIGMAHAFGFVYQRIMAPQQTPTVPLMINTYYPPNQVTPQRCYEFGRAVRRAVESWDEDLRVGVIASGGLSHFVVDEDLDMTTIDAFRNRDADTLRNLPREKLNSGNSEIRNWIAAAGASEHLNARLLDYVPCYRSPAGTGCGMGFVAWE